MDYRDFVVRVCSPLPELTGIPGLGDDRLCVRVGHIEPIAFVRILPPSYGLVIQALESGMVEPLSLQTPLGDLLSTLARAEGGYPTGLLPGPPSPSRPGSKVRLLHFPPR